MSRKLGVYYLPGRGLNRCLGREVRPGRSNPGDLVESQTSDFPIPIPSEFRFFSEQRQRFAVITTLFCSFFLPIFSHRSFMLSLTHSDETNRFGRSVAANTIIFMSRVPFHGISRSLATSFPGPSLYLEKVPWLWLVTCLYMPTTDAQIEAGSSTNFNFNFNFPAPPFDHISGIC